MVQRMATDGETPCPRAAAQWLTTPRILGRSFGRGRSFRDLGADPHQGASQLVHNVDAPSAPEAKRLARQHNPPTSRPRPQPYKGTGPALNDLIGGQFDFMCDQTLNVFQPVQGGLIKAYAATTKQRLAVLPDLPTAAESGLPDFEITVWFGMWAPKGTPKPVIDTLSAALQKALKDPEVNNRLAAAGAETIPSERAQPEALRAHLKSEIDRWMPIIKAAGIKAE